MSRRLIKLQLRPVRMERVALQQRTAACLYCQALGFERYLLEILRACIDLSQCPPQQSQLKSGKRKNRPSAEIRESNGDGA